MASKTFYEAVMSGDMDEQVYNSWKKKVEKAESGYNEACKKTDSQYEYSSITNSRLKYYQDLLNRGNRIKTMISNGSLKTASRSEADSLIAKLNQMTSGTERIGKFYSQFRDENDFYNWSYSNKYKGKSVSDIDTILNSQTPIRDASAKREYDWLNTNRDSFMTTDEIQKEIDDLEKKSGEQRSKKNNSFWSVAGDVIGRIAGSASGGVSMGSSGASEQYEEDSAELNETNARLRKLKTMLAERDDFDAENAYQQLDDRTHFWNVFKDDYTVSDYKNDRESKRIYGNAVVQKEYEKNVAVVNANAEMQQDFQDYAFYSGLVNTPSQNADSINAVKKMEEIREKWTGKGYDFGTLYDAYTRQSNAKTTEEAEAWATETTKEHPVLGNVLSVGTNLVGGVAALPDIIGTGISDAASDKPVAMDTNSMGFLGKNVTDAIRETTSEMIESGKYGQLRDFLYQTGMSMADMFATTAAMGGNAAAVQFIMGTNAGVDGVKTTLEKGGTTGEAIMSGLLYGVAEALFEKVSIETLFRSVGTNSIKNYVYNIAKSFVSEGSEELATDIANTISDALVNVNNTDFVNSIYGYMNEGKSASEAKALALGDTMMSMGQSFLGGALAGGLTAGSIGSVSLARANSQYEKIGNEVMQEGGTDTLMQLGNEMAPDNANIQYDLSAIEKQQKKSYNKELKTQQKTALNDAVKNRLSEIGISDKEIDAAANSVVKAFLNGDDNIDLTASEKSKNAAYRVFRELISTETDSGKNNYSNEWAVKALQDISDKATEKAKNKYKASNIGRLYSDVQEQSVKKVSSAYSDEMKKSVQSRIEELGMDKSTSRRGAEIVMKAISGEKMTASEHSLLKKNAVLARTYAELRSTDSEKEKWATDASVNAAMAYASAVGNTYDARMEPIRTAAQAKEAAAQMSAKEREKNAAVIDGKNDTAVVVDILGKTEDGVTVRLDNGSVAIVPTKSNVKGNTQTVTLQDEQTAHMIRLASDYRTPLTMKAFINGIEEGQDTLSYTRDFNSAYMQGLQGKNMNTAGFTISDEQARAAYTAGRGDRNAKLSDTSGNAAVDGMDFIGVVQKNSYKSGVTRLDSKSNLSYSDRRQIAVLDEYGKKHNLSFLIVDTLRTNQGIANGLAAGGNKIMIALDAEQGALLSVAGHEVFHYLKAQNPTDAKLLQDFVIDTLKKNKKYNYQQRFNELANRYETDNEDAINEEIAANAMFEVLSDEKTVQKLYDENKSLFNRMRDTIERFIAEIKEIIRQLGEKWDEVEALRDDRETLETIRAMFDSVMWKTEQDNKNTDTQDGETGKFSLMTSNKTIRSIQDEFYDLYLKATEKTMDFRLPISNGKAELMEKHTIDSRGRFDGYRITFHPAYGDVEEIITKTVREAVGILNSRGYKCEYELKEGVSIYNPFVFKNQELIDKYNEQQRIVKEHNDRIIKAHDDLINSVWEVLKKNGKETYIRFGSIPESGRSFNFRDQMYEDGISCFKAYKVGREYVVDVAGGYFTFLGYLKKQAYEITGDEMEHTGSDGEPVLENAEIMKKVSVDHVFDIKSFIGEVFSEYKREDQVSKKNDTSLETSSMQQDEKNSQETKKSLKSRDDEYLDAINNGDMETAQKLVDEAAKNAGYTERLYHGSKNGGGFTEFKDWQYFTPDQKYAMRYTENYSEDSLYSVYAKFENPFDTRISRIRDIYENEFYGVYSRTDLQESGLPDWTDGYDLVDFFEENDYDYDAILLDEGGDPSERGVLKRGISYVIKKSAQIKSAEAVTYDDSGNVIPLSQRFDESKPDIRFSLKERQDVIDAHEKLLRENDKLREANKILKEELSRTDGHTFGTKARTNTRTIAARLIREYKSTADAADIQKKIEGVFEYLARNGDVKGATESLIAIGEEVIEQSRLEDSEMNSPKLKELKKEMRESKLRLNQDTMEKVADAYGSYEKFRKAMFGRIRLVGDPSVMSLDEKWDDIVGRYGEIFTAEDMELYDTEQIDRLVDVLNTPTYYMVDGMRSADITEAAASFAYNAIGQFMEFVGPTFADKQAYKLEKTVDKYKNVLKQARAKQREIIRVKNEKIKETKQRYQDMIARQRDKRNDTQNRAKMRKHIIKKVNDLASMLTLPTDKKHIPEGLRSMVTEYLQLFTGDSAVMDEARIARVQNAYNRLMSEDDSAGVSQFMDDDIAAGFQELAQIARDITDGRRLSELNAEETKTIEDITDHLAKLVKDANTFFIDGKRQDRTELATSIMRELDETGSKVKKGMLSVMWNEITPYYFFKQASPTLHKVWGDVLDGQSCYGLRMDEARDRVLAMKEKHNVAAWEDDTKNLLTITTENGEELSFTVNQALGIYAVAKREAASNKNAQHLSMGGVVFPKKTSLKDKVETKLGKQQETNADAHQLSAADVAALQNQLTAEQIAFADDMIEYLSSDVAAWGNETSMSMYGYRKFTEKYYYPFHTSDYFKKTEADGNANESTAALKNKSMTKATVQNAKSPVVVEDFTEVCAKHISEMIVYSTLAEPQNNLVSLFNYKTIGTDTAAAVSVKTSLANALGNKANQYFVQIIRDMNQGARAEVSEKFMLKMLGKFKKNAVAANLSVIVQQPSAIGRAMALVDPKYFLTTAKKDGYEELKRYSGVAVIKEMGRFDIDTGRSDSDWIMKNNPTGIMDKVKAFLKDGSYRDDVFGWAAGKADEVTWNHIWQAVKKEVQDKQGLSGDELLVAAGKRFNEVIEATQVYDSVLTRSQLMRSHSTAVKMATSFMAEPIKTINLLYDAVYQAQGNHNKESMKYLSRAVGGVLTASLLNALSKSFITAGRDDDENQAFWEKYIEALVKNSLSEISVLEKLPFVKDIISLLQGYDITRTDIGMVGEFISAIQKLIKLRDDSFYMQTESEQKKQVKDAITNAIGSAGVFVGIPMKNIIRDLSAIVRSFKSINDGIDTTKQGIRYSSVDALIESFDNRIYNPFEKLRADEEDIYKAMVDGDDDKMSEKWDKYEEYLIYLGKDEETAYKQVRKAVKDKVKVSVLKGELSDEDAERYLISYLDDANGYWTVKEWHFSVDDANDGLDFSKYDRLKADVLAGNDISEAVKELTDHNTKESTVRTRVTSIIEDAYEKDEITIDRAEELLRRYMGFAEKQSMSSNPIDEEKDVIRLADKWEGNKGLPDGEYYTAYDALDTAILEGTSTESAIEKLHDLQYTDSDIKTHITATIREAYTSGDLNASLAKSKLTKYTDYSSEEAADKIKVWDFKEKNPDSDFEESTILKYLEVSDVGISLDVYTDYYERQKECTGTKDENGKTISGSKKAEILKVIDSLPITSKQKDALYYQNGYKQSTLYEAPWH